MQGLSLVPRRLQSEIPTLVFTCFLNSFQGRWQGAEDLATLSVHDTRNIFFTRLAATEYLVRAYNKLMRHVAPRCSLVTIAFKSINIHSNC
jgi:hypothetical protein